MSHFHIDVLFLDPSGRGFRATMCVPWQGVEIFDGVLILKDAAMKQGPFWRAFAPNDWGKLTTVEHD